MYNFLSINSRVLAVIGVVGVFGAGTTLAMTAHDVSQNAQQIHKQGRKVIHEQRQERRELRNTQLQERKELLHEQRRERIEGRAKIREEVVGARKELRAQRRERAVERRIKRIEHRAQKFEQRFAHVTKKFDSVISRLQNAGVDTSDIEKHVNTLTVKANAIKSAVRAYDDAIANGDNEARQKARATYQSTKNDFHQFYRNTLRPAIVTAIVAARK